MKVYDVNGNLVVTHNHERLTVYRGALDDSLCSTIAHINEPESRYLVYKQIDFQVGRRYKFRDIVPKHNMVIVHDNQPYTYSEDLDHWLESGDLGYIQPNEVVQIIHLGEN